MSVHDKAAARNARRFTLTALRYSNGCMQTFEYPNLTQREIEEKKTEERAMTPECPYGSRMVTFEISSC